MEVRFLKRVFCRLFGGASSGGRHPFLVSFFFQPTDGLAGRGSVVGEIPALFLFSFSLRTLLFDRGGSVSHPTTESPQTTTFYEFHTAWE